MYDHYVNTVSIHAIFLYSIRGGYPNKLLNCFVPLVTHLLIARVHNISKVRALYLYYELLLIAIDFQLQTKNAILKSKNA